MSKEMRRAAPLFLLALGACAHVEELPDGSRRVTGLVRMTVPAMAQEQRGADMLEVKALGLLILTGSAANSVSFGYSTERIIALRNNARVDIRE